MLLRSPAFAVLNKGTLVAASLAIITAVPTLANASTLESQSKSLNQQLASTVHSPSNGQQLTGMIQGNWLIADKDDKKGRGHDRDDDDDKDGGRRVRVDLNRAKNIARQAAEEANGGLQVYRAEASMHGPAERCPYVDNGDSWTFTFLGGRPGSTSMTTESVVTVYKKTAKVVVAYNGVVRTVRQTTITSFTTSQRTVLVDLLRGNCSCNYLLTDAVRTQIISQSRSLPPGIQKNLMRGKGLPPGIAKKLVPLPKQVNTYINLPTYYDLYVIGSDVLLVDQTNYTVVDMISNVVVAEQRRDEREIRVDLNRAKNIARQAAEEANGGLQVYRAEASMHGPAERCPYVDNGDSWTFTFLGGRPGSTSMTTESVVTVYKKTAKVVVAYNGVVRTVRQTTITSFTTSQRTVLVDLLRGNCSCNYLLTDAVRTQIISQSRSLPPGIQKNLLRGKGLPPGIAKKLVPLPKQVNNYINLPNSYDLFVLGSNVVLMDQVNYTIVDLISDAF